jgi:phosphatidylinositol-3-phosphatase
MASRFLSILGLMVLAAAMGCGGGGSNNLTGSGGSTGGSPPPSTFVPDHVFLVVMENHGFSQVIGSSSMPYLNSLANAHSLATNYFADTHPSIDNYFILTAGKKEANDNDSFTGTVTDDNIARALVGAGKTWKAYMESIPSAGYVGGDVYPYFRHHNPFSYLSDVNSASGPTAQAANMVPFTQLATDLSAGALPSFAFIAPNAEDDAHDCPGGGSLCDDSAKLSTADTWLKNNIDPLINNPALANSVFIITWDESLDLDIIHGGGQVATVFAGAHVKPAFKSTAFYQHENLLRTVLDLLKVSDHPGNSATAGSMGDMFQ